MVRKKSIKVQTDVLKRSEAKIQTRPSTLPWSKGIQTNLKLERVKMEDVRELTKAEVDCGIITLAVAGHTNASIVEQLAALDVSRKHVFDVVKRFKETGSSSRRKCSGRRKTVRGRPGLIETIKNKVADEPTKSMRRLAKEEGISKRSIARICHEDLGLKSYKKVKAQYLRPMGKGKRLLHTRAILDIINNREAHEGQVKALNGRENERIEGHVEGRIEGRVEGRVEDQVGLRRSRRVAQRRLVAVAHIEEAAVAEIREHEDDGEIEDCQRLIILITYLIMICKCVKIQYFVCKTLFFDLRG